MSNNVNHNKDSDSNTSGWPFNRAVIDNWPQACYHYGYNIFRWWYWMRVITMQYALAMVSIKPYKKNIRPCLLLISRSCLHLLRDSRREACKHKFVRIHLGMCTLLWIHPENIFTQHIPTHTIAGTRSRTWINFNPSTEMITAIIKYEMLLLIYSQTSTVQSLKFGKG